MPRDIEYKKIKINTGAGKIDIEALKTEKLLIELGAGETEIQNLNVSKDAKLKVELEI